MPTYGTSARLVHGVPRYQLAPPRLLIADL